MNKETLIKRLQPAMKKDGTLQKKYKSALLDVAQMVTGRKIHPFRWVRSCGHFGISGESNYNCISEICLWLKLKPLRGNDAPRKGIEGDYIYLSNADKKKLYGINFSDIE